MLKKLLLILLISILLGGNILGCNTIHGFGQDVEEAGEKVQDAAD